MTKIILTIKDKKEKDSVETTLTTKIEGLDKATESEKVTTHVIYSKVLETLKTLQNLK